VVGSCKQDNELLDYLNNESLDQLSKYQLFKGYPQVSYYVSQIPTLIKRKMMPNENKLLSEETCQFPVYLASANSRAFDNKLFTIAFNFL
jgi:hypothetical protein